MKEESPSISANCLFQNIIDLEFESGFVSNIDFFEVTQFEFVSKIEGHKHNNGIRHEKYHFTDHQSDLTNDSGGVQASFFLSSLAMVRSTL